MTDLALPVRVDIRTGARLEPTGLDPYKLPWVEGAADTLPKATRDKHKKQINDLRKRTADRRLRRKESTINGRTV
jgi:hypothetical protein